VPMLRFARADARTGSGTDARPALRLLLLHDDAEREFDYTDGAAGEEISLLRSRQAYARVEFQPTALRDVSTVDTSTMILGRLAALPRRCVRPGLPLAVGA